MCRDDAYYFIQCTRRPVYGHAGSRSLRQVDAQKTSREVGKRGGIMFEAIIGDYAYLLGPLCLIKEARSALLCAPRASSRGPSQKSRPLPVSRAHRRHEYNFRRRARRDSGSASTEN